jgi:adenosylmethionine---8-amino-7-oxononanoate aminotransferase
MDSIWYPYTQMKDVENQYEVSSADGVYLALNDGKKVIDAISSWWCVIYGYKNREINQAIEKQLNSMAHVMLGGLTHEPVKKLAKKLVEITPDGLNHVFFSDSGSTGVEVALKMAIQYQRNLGRKKKYRFLALKKAYHGDTCGVMSVGDPDDGMHSIFSGILPKQLFINSPKMGFVPNMVKMKEDLSDLEQILKSNHQDLAAFIVEPLMQAAGGFNFYAPEYLKKAKELCDQYHVLMIFDEVATGFGRTGTMFAADRVGICPDIMVLGKGLTGGYIGHAATLATTKIFESFYSDDKSKAFMHGPTFMGNPLACAAALKSIEIFRRDKYLEKIKKIEELLKRELFKIQSDKIEDIRVLGATGVIEVKDKDCLDGVQEFAISQGVWLRPFEKYLYTMPAYIIKEQELAKITQVMMDFFKEN